MMPTRTLIAMLCVAAAGCSGGEQKTAQAASIIPVAAAEAATPAPKADEPPPCTNARVHDLVKETFIRRVLVEGDHALVERQALAPEDAFTEAQIVEAMPRMLALARLEAVQEVSYDPAHQQRRCRARLAVQSWDVQPPVTYRVASVSDSARFGVESSVQLLPGAEGFNMLQGYRSTFGNLIK
jgi:hypothetical protein